MDMVAVPRVSEVARAGSPNATADEDIPLSADAEALRSLWTNVEERLADDPQGALRAAEALVGAARRRLEERAERGEELDADLVSRAAAGYRTLLVQLLAVEPRHGGDALPRPAGDP